MPCSGTVQYQAPELYKGAKKSEKTDIFAFGVILYKMMLPVGAWIWPGQYDRLEKEYKVLAFLLLLLLSLTCNGSGLTQLRAHGLHVTYSNPTIPDMSAEVAHCALHAAGTCLLPGPPEGRLSTILGGAHAPMHGFGSYKAAWGRNCGIAPGTLHALLPQV